MSQVDVAIEYLQGSVASVVSTMEIQRLKNQRLLKALERLGSMEAFDLSRSIQPKYDKELLARIDFARSIAKVETS